MAMGNLKKSKETTPITTTAFKGSTLEDHFLQELKSPPFGPHLMKFSKTVSYEVNLAAQS